MNWITRLMVVAVFVLGAVSGVMVGMRLEREKLLNMQRNSASTLTDRALERISNEVKLAPEQQHRLGDILKGVQPILAAGENGRRTKIIATMEFVRNGAFAFLDPNQRERYNALHQRMKNRLFPQAGELAATAAIFAWFR